METWTECWTLVRPRPLGPLHMAVVVLSRHMCRHGSVLCTFGGPAPPLSSWTSLVVRPTHPSKVVHHHLPWPPCADVASHSFFFSSHLATRPLLPTSILGRLSIIHHELALSTPRINLPPPPPLPCPLSVPFLSPVAGAVRGRSSKRVGLYTAVDSPHSFVQRLYLPLVPRPLPSLQPSCNIGFGDLLLLLHTLIPTHFPAFTANPTNLFLSRPTQRQRDKRRTHTHPHRGPSFWPLLATGIAPPSGTRILVPSPVVGGSTPVTWYS